MLIIFCSDPLHQQVVDTDYEKEYRTAQKCGFDVGLINFEDLIQGDITHALRRIAKALFSKKAIYRGWMMQPKVYQELYQGLQAKNIELINNYDEYKHCHYLPESYEVIRELAPKTVWLHNQNPENNEILEVLKPFGSASIIVKDFVKSQKHRWNEACFIPRADDCEGVNRVVSCFLQLQGSELNEGLVFREYVCLEPLANHSKSGMPLTKEFRVFFWEGEPLVFFPYWEEGDYGLEKPDLDVFFTIAKQVKSRFFTMDIAKRVDESWMIIELGDGQVAGLPDNFDENLFYANLAERV